ncbi:MAG: hypothetical protein LBT44_10035 [Clostridiales bacterium]|nr:hypothetical protein [Clostridiales bacterium]
MLFIIPVVSLLGFAVLDLLLWNWIGVYVTLPIMSMEKAVFYIVIVLEILAEIFIARKAVRMGKAMRSAQNKKVLMKKKKQITVADVSKTIVSLESKALEPRLSRMKKRFNEYASLKSVLDSSLSMLFEEGQYTYETFAATIDEMDAVIVRISLSFITIFDTFRELGQKTGGPHGAGTANDFLDDLFARLDEIGEIFDSVLTKLKMLLVQLAKLEHLSVEEFKALGSVVELENLIQNTALYKNI